METAKASSWVPWAVGEGGRVKVDYILKGNIFNLNLLSILTKR
jgi:hypothetical protein